MEHLDKFMFIYLLYINSSFICYYRVGFCLITYFHTLIKKFVKEAGPNQKLMRVC